MKIATLPAKAIVVKHIQGSRTFSKISYPVHTGIYSEIETDNHVFHFNLNHEIIRIKAKGASWRHPHEWLKRTMGDDWIYYSTGGYTGVFEATGEYYLPNFTYSSNSILGGNPFRSPEIADLTKDWYPILTSRTAKYPHDHTDADFLNSVLQNNPRRLKSKADEFHNVIDGHISVLPPDARHVEYHLIPIMISRGCLYKCKFCKVKNRHAFHELELREIDSQINQMKTLYGRDLANYNSVYLGEHDALQASAKTIIYALKQAYTTLGLYNSYLDGVNCFLFGSATSLLEAPESLFEDLHKLPGKIYINIGLESPDQSTLDQLGKPITTCMVRDAFKRIQTLNMRYPDLEISSNFIMDGNLPSGHYREIERLIRDTQTYQQAKGSIYFSPLTFDQPSRARLFEFNRLKLMSRFPTYLYIIQRL
ncbi:MAG: hypothetical protein ACI8ZB_001806 [Desulforhopalus sp.]|jgi:hypothetical protein